MQRQYTYPTLGEAIKFVFDATGLSSGKDLPAVEGSSFHDMNIKTLNKQLNRLAEESGALQPQLESLLKLYTEELGIYVTCPVMRAQLAELFNDLYQPYRNTLKQFSTFMSKQATVRYLLTTFAVRSCVVSWQLQALATSAANNQQPRPTQQFWFLPQEEEGELVSPAQCAAVGLQYLRIIPGPVPSAYWVGRPVRTASAKPGHVPTVEIARQGQASELTRPIPEPRAELRGFRSFRQPDSAGAAPSNYH